MSIIRTADRSTSPQASGFKLRETGISGSRPAVPLYINAGGIVDNAAGTISPAWPVHTVGDLGILVWECSGDGTTITPSGWTLMPDAPIVDIADATGSKLNLAYRFAVSSSEANASIGSTGDHAVGRIFTFRNVSTSRVPGADRATGAKTTASTTLTYPSVNTAAPNSLVVGVASRPNDSSSTTEYSGYTNANLTSITERAEGGSTLGNGGGIALWTGISAAIQSTGTTTATSVTSFTNAYYVFALSPSLALPA